MLRCSWLLVSAVLLAFLTPPASAADAWWVYIGTYTNGKSEGIYRSRLDRQTGQLTPAELAAPIRHPSFLAVHPSQKFLYAVGETNDFQDQPSGAISAFAIDRETGALQLLNQQPSHGGAPCHLVVDQRGTTVLMANYGGGNVSARAIGSDGRLGQQTALEQHEGSSVNSQRQQRPHAHCVQLSPDNRFAFVADLGLDKVMIYRFDSATGSLHPHEPPSVSVEPGSGPRHFTFHPSGQFAYVINELASTVTAFRYDASRGSLQPLQTISTLPDGYQQASFTAEVVVHPSGQFLYGSNRGHDSIAVFTIDQDSGQLQRVQIEPTQGKTPRNFAIDPSGTYLLAENQGSDTIVVFRIDADSGQLVPTGQVLQVPTPVCVKFVAVR